MTPFWCVLDRPRRPSRTGRAVGVCRDRARGERGERHTADELHREEWLRRPVRMGNDARLEDLRDARVLQARERL